MNAADQILAASAISDTAAEALADVLAPYVVGVSRAEIFEFARGEFWLSAQDVARVCNHESARREAQTMHPAED